ncbi:hypothetical protein A0H81_14077 [Grifola frondosa]|uniref:Uncharacterized protein n=1 Tax=Grifola frondosa TaxID=5627 RepID=A0A1C7LPC8_GRIFR|nr:hypothetical protein A0H81_14077 [Grifola frondosa]
MRRRTSWYVLHLFLRVILPDHAGIDCTVTSTVTGDSPYTTTVTKTMTVYPTADMQKRVVTETVTVAPTHGELQKRAVITITITSTSTTTTSSTETDSATSTSSVTTTTTSTRPTTTSTTTTTTTSTTTTKPVATTYVDPRTTVTRASRPTPR